MEWIDNEENDYYYFIFQDLEYKILGPKQTQRPYYIAMLYYDSQSLNTFVIGNQILSLEEAKAMCEDHFERGVI